MGFGVGFLAERATKAAKTVAVLTKALARCITSPASHCFGCFCFGLHTYNNTAYGSCCQRKSTFRCRLFLFSFDRVATRIEMLAAFHCQHHYARFTVPSLGIRRLGPDSRFLAGCWSYAVGVGSSVSSSLLSRFSMRHVFLRHHGTKLRQSRAEICA